MNDAYRTPRFIAYNVGDGFVEALIESNRQREPIAYNVSDGSQGYSR